MKENATSTEGVLWSICGDLLALPDVPIRARDTDGQDCRVATIADRFRYTIDKFTDTEVDDTVGKIEERSLLRQLSERTEFFKTAASHERATSIKGALFQLSAVASFVDQALESSWRDATGGGEDDAWNPSETTTALQRDIYRLLYSGVRTIAQAFGIPEKEFAGDYFLNIDPFKDLEA
jgi:hypothetical protein